MSLPAPRSLPLPHSFRPLSMVAGLRAASRRTPNKVAVTHGANRRTFAEFIHRVDLATNVTISDLHLSRGQNAAIFAHNCIEYFEVTVGLPEAGIPVATINIRLTAAEVVAICDDVEARVLFVDAAAADLLGSASFKTVERVIVFGPQYEEWLRKGNVDVARPTIEEWDTWTIPYTSGTTGRPKGVMLSHRARILAFFARSAEHGCFSAVDKFLSITPMSHGAGLSFPLSAIFFGGSTEILDKFDPELVLRKLKTENVTGIFTVPTHFHAFFELGAKTLAKYDRPPIKSIISNAAPLSQAMKEQIVPYFGEGILHEIFSSTENGLCTSLRPEDQLRKIRCVGLPYPHVMIKIVNDKGEECAPGEVGELLSNSPYIFSGYWNRPEETEAAFKDGWVTVGDMAKRDEEGYVYIVDRKKDMVITGGVNVYPREIENVLTTHPAVVEAAVVGVEDSRWGERLRAFVVLKDGLTLDEQSLATFCEGKLAAYKIPKQVSVLKEFPRNATGKVLKTELRKLP